MRWAVGFDQICSEICSRDRSRYRALNCGDIYCSWLHRIGLGGALCRPQRSSLVRADFVNDCTFPRALVNRDRDYQVKPSKLRISPSLFLKEKLFEHYGIFTVALKNIKKILAHYWMWKSCLFFFARRKQFSGAAPPILDSRGNRPTW